MQPCCLDGVSRDIVESTSLTNVHMRVYPRMSIGAYTPFSGELSPDPATNGPVALEDFMRILVVGAGAIGGYFGARLLEARGDVTFLVRPRRAAQLARGVSVVSRFGNIDLSAPPTMTAESLREAFDLILLSCKAYDLEGAMDSFAPAVGAGTAILPLLNGMRHMDLLSARFGAERVLGVPDLGRARSGGQGAPSQRHAPACVRRTGRHAFGAGPGDRVDPVGRQVRGAAERDHSPGDVGEVGVQSRPGRGSPA
jgi:hypothetical protein